MSSQARKLVVVGDGAVGKTSLLISFTKGEFPTVYVPSVFELQVLDMDVKGKLIELELWDTVAQGDSGDRVRPLSYQGAHALIICFSIGWPDSLDNVIEKWDPELKQFGGEKVPRFLVGCKKDLRNDQTTILELSRLLQTPVTTAQGEEMAKTIGAEYLECSSKTGEGVRELFAKVTESMEAEKVVRLKQKMFTYHRPSFGGDGCVVL